MRTVAGRGSCGPQAPGGSVHRGVGVTMSSGAGPGAAARPSTALSCPIMRAGGVMGGLSFLRWSSSASLAARAPHRIVFAIPCFVFSADHHSFRSHRSQARRDHGSAVHWSIYRSCEVPRFCCPNRWLHHYKPVKTCPTPVSALSTTSRRSSVQVLCNTTLRSSYHARRVGYP